MEHQATLTIEPATGAGIPGERGLTVDLARTDIEAARASAGGGLAELLLELETRDRDGDASRHTLVLGCTAADLDRLLADNDDNVLIRFDAEGLGRAITTDVEAHGLREKMAVVAMVVATTGAAAGAAQAMPALGGHGYPAGDPAATTSAAAAATSGAPAPRADPALAAKATMAQSEWGGQASSGQLGPYSGGGPFQTHRDGQLGPYSGGAPFREAQRVSPARDLPADSVKASESRPVAHGATGATMSESSAVDSTAVVIAGGVALTLIGVAFAAAAASRRTPTPI